ncbi:MAG: CHAT domain-containing protein [Cyanobacteria bacterium P01_A01_bin.137]
MHLEQRFAQGTPAQLIQQGREYYTEGRYADAISTWQQAAQAYETQSDAINQASALSNIGLAHLRLGNYSAAEDEIATARTQLTNIPDSPYPQRILAQVVSAQAQLSMAQGNFPDALQHLEQATNLYQNLEAADGLLLTQLNQAQILQVQGRYGAASKQLENIQDVLNTLDDPAIKAAGLRRLANTQRLNGQTAEALTNLQASQDVAETINNRTELSSTLLSLGNLVAESSDSLPDNDEVESEVFYYQAAAEIAPTLSLRLQAQINLLGLQIAKDSLNPELLNDIQNQLPQVGTGRTANLIRLNLANHLIEAQSLWSSEELAQFLADTLQQAEGDSQSQSYAWGYWGKLYETSQQWDAAAEATQKAWNLALGSNSDTALYQWQWQLGRILAAQGDDESAIAAYSQALETLQRLRSDLVSTDTDLQFSFREEVEPIYRELVGLLLKSDTSVEGKASENLLTARSVIENLQVAELVNFFRADCVVTNRTEIDEIDTSAAVVYPIILDDSLEVIVRYPGQDSENSLMHYSINVEKDTIERQLDRLQKIISTYPSSGSRAGISAVSTGESLEDVDFLTPAGQIYDWLIRPITDDLEKSNTEVLVFVLDGALRNVPMSVLYDQEDSKYLIEEYEIALTPGLQLIDPQPIARGQVKALVGGLSMARGGFSELPFVGAEVDAIKAQVPSEVLLNQTFEINRFRDNLTNLPFPVVHLATHGQFSAELDNTFIQAWDGRINANELSSMLQLGELSRDETIELLILSACETASGDERAALGLAGIAVRSGARSTLATLWQVNDEGTSVLMSQFYQKLADTSLTKAEILREVQLNLLQDPTYQDPYFWAPFVLIGNWL